MNYLELKQRVGDDPHDLAAEIQVDSIPAEARVATLFEAFEDLRSYGMVMYIKHEFDAAGEGLRADILSRFRHYLEGGDEPLVEQVLYTLWCDYFEDQDAVAEAWQELAAPGSPPLVLQRLLTASGPVPWRLKKPLLDSLALGPEWHPWIFECLLRSTFDVLGSTDKRDARRLFARLKLDPGTEYLDRLRAALR